MSAFVPCGRYDCDVRQPCLSCYPRTSTMDAYERHKALEKKATCTQCGRIGLGRELLFAGFGNEYDTLYVCTSCGHSRLERDDG